jgi:hypothetical protein
MKPPGTQEPHTAVDKTTALATEFEGTRFVSSFLHMNNLKMNYSKVTRTSITQLCTGTQYIQVTF